MAVLGDGAPLSLAAAVSGMDVMTASRLERPAGPDRHTRERGSGCLRASVGTAVGLRRAHPGRTGRRPCCRGRAAWRGGSAGAGARVHCAALRPARSETVASTLLRAADDALARAAPEAAIRWLRRALNEDATAPPRAQLLFRLGEAEMAVRDPVAAEHLNGALALAGDDDALRVRVAATLTELLIAIGRWNTALSSSGARWTGSATVSRASTRTRGHPCGGNRQ